MSLDIIMQSPDILTGHMDLSQPWFIFIMMPQEFNMSSRYVSDTTIYLQTIFAQ